MDKRTVRFLAIDLGKFNTMYCFFDSKARKHSFHNATTERNFLPRTGLELGRLNHFARQKSRKKSGLSDFEALFFGP
jgi:hypothetical protein